MKKINSLITIIALSTGIVLGQQKKAVDPAKQKMDSFINGLMAKMTVEEKIGQLNLPVFPGDIVTGLANSSNMSKQIKSGHVGGLFNIKGVDKIKAVQKVAVEQTRLKIPLLFGMDVIHGYQTVFPIPLGLSCTWDMDAIQQSARIAAVVFTGCGPGTHRQRCIICLQHGCAPSDWQQMGVDVCRFVGFPNNRCEGVTLTSSNCTALMIGERERES